MGRERAVDINTSGRARWREAGRMCCDRLVRGPAHQQLLTTQPCLCLYTKHIIPQHTPELGIDIPSILSKTKAILLHQMKAPCLEDLDFGGALVYLLALGCLHLLVSKRCMDGEPHDGCSLPLSLSADSCESCVGETHERPPRRVPHSCRAMP